jgi:uncharacterized protein YbjQ (UPF0145 family)
MKISFDRLPDDARLWVFATSRALTALERDELFAEVDGCREHWTAHGAPVVASRDWRDDRFLLIGVDERATGLSGCSIDALIRSLATLEQGDHDGVARGLRDPGDRRFRRAGYHRLRQHARVRRRAAGWPVRDPGSRVLARGGLLPGERHVIITTTPTIQGAEIIEYFDIVTGEAILGANIFKDFFAGIRDIVGGRSAAYEGELRRAREVALKEMAAEAAELGANAIVGVDIDYETIQVGHGGSMLMVSASGTAVRLTA